MTDSLASRASKGTATLDELTDREPIGDPPDYLSEFAKEKWRGLVADLDRLGVSDSSLRTSLENLCRDQEIADIADNSLRTDGIQMLVEGPRGRKMSITNPAAAVLSAARTRIQTALNGLGLTVASQAKIKPKAPGEKTEDPFEKYD